MADFTSITEVPGRKLSKEELDMICCRYYTAGKYVDGKEVMEVGCGPGLGFSYLLEKGARQVIGGDINMKSLALADRNCKRRRNAHVLNLDAHHLPFRSGRFDCILMFEAIFYLRHPTGFLSECNRVLRKDGVLIICLPNRESITFRPSEFSTQYFTGEEMAHTLEICGFRPEIYGAFPIQRKAPIQRILTRIRRIGAIILNGLPAPAAIKNRIKNRAFNKNFVLGEEIQECVREEGYRLKLLPRGYDGGENRILYSIGRKTD